MPVLKEGYTPGKPTLYHGTGTPYIALFDTQARPILNSITGLPLGYYVDDFSYTFQEANSTRRRTQFPGNECKIVIKFGDPDVVDIEPLQKNATFIIQFGYVFSDGTFRSSAPISVMVRQVDTIFNEEGITTTILTKDGTDVLRYFPPYSPQSDSDTLLDYLEKGCGIGAGVLIKKFKGKTT